ncbi:dsDNA-specific endonuclease/ATPase MutS2 [Paraburkholderia sp. GAS333]|uniref:hypothetical protein n=1 Tax=Paraburkholderia sp. GAS333 TaxID=3156279 RepID=UPI003D1D5044
MKTNRGKSALDALKIDTTADLIRKASQEEQDIVFSDPEAIGLARLVFVEDVREALETLLTKASVKHYPEGRVMLEKAITNLPAWLTQASAGHVASALGSLATSNAQRERASGAHKKDEKAAARKLYDAMPGSRPLSKAARAQLKNDIFEATGVAWSTIDRWLAEFETA